MKTYVMRLLPNDDLKESIIGFVKENNINAGYIASCGGSLKHAGLRLADEQTKEFNGPFEILSLSGTVSVNGCHLHISLGDKRGHGIGGHLKENCLIKTTAEIVIMELEDVKFDRILDRSTGYKELVIR